MLFIAMVLVIVGLIHFYLWKRLVRDPLRPGPARRAGTALAVLLFVLFPVTMGGVRAGHLTWLAWPGYLWIAVMFYLLITLLVLEIPRLLALRLWARTPGEGSDRASHAPGTAAAPGSPAAEPLPTAEPALNGSANGHASAPTASERRGEPALSSAASGHGSESLGGGEAALSGSGAVTLAAGGAAAVDTVDEAGAAGESGGASRQTADDDAAGHGDAGREPADGDAAGHGDAGREPTDDDAAGHGGASRQTADGGPAGHGGASRQTADGGPAGHGGAGREPADGDAAGHGGGGQGPGMDRRLLLARGTAIFAGLTAASITGYGVKTATGAPQIDRVQLRIAKLPRSMDGTRLAVVSDIHIGPLTGVEHARRITRVINSVNADLVCVVGDLVDGSVAELGRFAAPLGGIESRHGAFFVTGNHEYYSGAEEWVEEVARLGIRPLRNERVEINGLDLAGVNDLTGEEQGDGPDFARALGDRDTTRPVVLMAHQPVAAKEAAPYGVDLQVSGHTHGGQMAPFNMLVKLQQPVVSGFGKVDGVPVYVTNGAGFWGPPVRVGAPPQVTVIELRVA
ncbi:putative MPP superfamily phosphohydrolase [Actinoplanes lobatus]|uniref:Putative MPP superfamily phosphohydrolase n=1 Tax=Actinoplanes lobatus TaxID=113568 RepID=A0A7W7HC76_9ACTN|nr:putative MPP superfamily phosphohydrolase [Actinoplanes lobatus]